MYVMLWGFNVLIRKNLSIGETILKFTFPKDQKYLF